MKYVLKASQCQNNKTEAIQGYLQILSGHTNKGSDTMTCPHLYLSFFPTAYDLVNIELFNCINYQSIIGRR